MATYSVKQKRTNFFLISRGHRGSWPLYPVKINDQTSTSVRREVNHQPQFIAKASKLMPKSMNFGFFASHYISKIKNVKTLTYSWRLKRLTNANDRHLYELVLMSNY